MFVLYVKIDYYFQLKRIDEAHTQDMERALAQIVAQCGGVPFGKEDPFTASFDESSLFSRLLLVEATERIKCYLETLDDELPGFTIIVHSGTDNESIASHLKNTWCRIQEPCGTWISREAMDDLASYVLCEAVGNLNRYRGTRHGSGPKLPDAFSFARRSHDVETLSGIAGDAFVSDGLSMVYIHYPECTEVSVPMAESLLLLGYPRESFMELRAGSFNPRPFEIFTDGRVEPSFQDRQDHLSLSERLLYDQTKPAFDIVAGSPFRMELSERVVRGMNTFLTLCLRTWVRRLSGQGLPAIMILHTVHRYSPETQDFIAELLSGGENLVFICGSETKPPGSWSQKQMRTVEVAPASLIEYKPALNAFATEGVTIPIAKIFALSRGNPLDLYRRAWLCSLGLQGIASERAAINETALSNLPLEASLVLYAAFLAENILDSDRFASFLDSLGLLSEGRKLILDLLRNKGFIEESGPILVQRPRAVDFPRAIARQRGRIDAAFSSYLIKLYQEQSFLPSLGLFAAAFTPAFTAGFAETSGGNGEEKNRFASDCAFSDAFLDPIRIKRVFCLDYDRFDMLSVRAAAFALVEGDEEACGRAVDNVEQSADSQGIPAVITSMLKTERLYAAGQIPGAIQSAKDALMGMGKVAESPKIEAFALRLLGLCSLAAEKTVEAGEYFLNAYEMAETAHDDYERMMCAWYSGCAYFIHGDCARSLRQADMAIAASRAMYRKDWESWLEFFKGRVLFELGSLDEAVAQFSAARCAIRIYGPESAEKRVSIWTARALAHSGSWQEAAQILETYPADSEAVLFLAETELLRSDTKKAGTILDRYPHEKKPVFQSAETFNWDFAFQSIEGRGVSFAAQASLSGDLATAYGLLARGLSCKSGECALELFAMTREKRISEGNPYLMHYYLFCFLVLETLDEPPMDRATVLSRAYKEFQARSSRIGDHALRVSFSENNAWIRKLLEAARRYKFL